MKALMLWTGPARSPDLNPIEHIWDIMSRSIHQRHVAPQTVQELADALVQVWEEIPQETIRHLIRKHAQALLSRSTVVMAAHPAAHPASLALLISLAFGATEAIRALKEGPMIDAEGREFKSATFRADVENSSRPQHSEASTVCVYCTEAFMIIEVKADLYKNGCPVSPGELFLGEAEHWQSSQCRAVTAGDSNEYIIEAALQDCGSTSRKTVIYSNKLIISPAAGYHGITRVTNAVVPVSCHYKRTHFVSSGAQQPPLIFSTSAKHPAGNSDFSLKLMTDDWTSERVSTVFFLGDPLHLKASYTGADSGRGRLFIDSCVATLSPDTTSLRTMGKSCSVYNGKMWMGAMMCVDVVTGGKICPWTDGQNLIKYKEQKAVKLHFLDNYTSTEGLKTEDLVNSLQLFDRTSWIFCNGRKNFPGGEETCDEKTWIKTRKKKLKKVVSLICNDILPRGSFVVLFLLMSDVEQPLVETFHEFYAEMNGHDFLAVISESKENYNKWSSLAQVSCHMSSLKEISIVEMPLSHVDATVQSIQIIKNQPNRTLPGSNGAVCFLKSAEEAMLDSLEIISIDQCDETNLEIMTKEEIKEIESYFYRGGKIDWIHFWLADKHKCEAIIQRDAYGEANTIMEKTVHLTKAMRPIESVNIYHHPGSGGSTVARQILWNCGKKIRCAVVRQSKEITTVCEHAVRLREHDKGDKNKCLPVLLLLEDCHADYIDYLRRELGNVIATKKISSSVLCFILLICNRLNNSEKMCRASPSQTVAVTHKLSNAEKPLFSNKREQLEREFDSDFILTFVLMSKDFEHTYIEDFVKNILEKTDHSLPITRLTRFVALLNYYVRDSYISVSHCEASLGIANYVDKARYHAFVDHLSEEAKLIFIHLREGSTHMSSIQIINSLVAGKILSQLSAKFPQSDIAMDLINDKVLLNHRFDRDEFLKFIRALFIRRSKRSRGDPVDTVFSPLIEHVSTEKGGVQKAVDLMKAAYIALGKDPYVAQQLARLLYTNLRFEEALEWAEEAKSLLPCDTFVLDTLGQVYKKWFYHLYDMDVCMEKEPSPERATEIISIALKGISALRASEKTPKKETVSLNSSYYGEVDVGCRLLKFLSGVDVFVNNTGKSELMDYLLTDYIPADVKRPWQKFHGQLKGLQKSLSNALECISEDLSYFQTDISEEDEELDARDPEQVYNPRKWLTRKSAVYAGFFCITPDESDQAVESNSTDMASPPEKLSPFQRQIRTYKLGVGNFTSILSLLYDKNRQRAGEKLETIIGMYPEKLTRNCLDQTELANFILCQIALNCTLPGSSKLMSLEKLQDLSNLRFITSGKKMSTVSALFLLSLLLWPETNNELSSADTEILLSAIDALQRLCWQKSQHVPQRKRKIMTHFFLAKAKGLNKIVHRSAIDKLVKNTRPERKLQWLEGKIWKTEEVKQLLENVEGWTENGNLFVQGGTRGSKIRVFPRYSASLPNGNEKVTFYLGFSFDGVFAFDIQCLFLIPQ
ncbi:hypothetical protein L3Q82_002772 [Scortum barcoo]|uniref:Uncharacterized protein n=1 Tax=Scortum barcoo TaxID=214431 RepID=A0ACB8VUM2_9TELE|nr:hypothetical protein L3Q82_002772 [Scortum barcoo]